MGNINIYKKPFDQSKGYQIYQNDKVNLIILRFDKIDQYTKIIRENTPFSNFVLPKENMAQNKWYKNIYVKFLNRIVIPKNVLDKIIRKHQKDILYFYGQEYLEKYKEKWYSRLNKNKYGNLKN